MSQETLVYINNGISQNERAYPLLLPESVKIDDRTILSLVSFLSEYASLLNYYNHNKLTGEPERDGDWSFFTNDAIFNLADIATSDTGSFSKEISLIQHVFQKEQVSLSEMVYALRLLFDLLIQLFTKINTWLAYAENLPEDFSEKLTKIVQLRLSPLLIESRNWADFYGKTANRSDYTYFDATQIASFNKEYWQYDADIQTPKYLVVEENGKSFDNHSMLLRNHRPIIDIAQEIINQHNKLADIAKSTFYKLLDGKSDKNPNLGLLLTFLNLFEKAQQKINRIPERHLNFYYRDVLKFTENKIIPDKTFVVISPVPGTQDMLLKQGLLFNAGKDPNGNTITYHSLLDTVVNQVQVAELKTLYVAANAIAQPPGRELEKPLITGIFSASHPYPVAQKNGFPLFGEDQFMYSGEQQTMSTVNPGFAVSSVAFFLSEGQRTITVSLQFTESSFSENFVHRIRELAAKTGQPDFDGIFRQIFHESIQVQGTGLKGWFPLQVSGITYAKGPVPCLNIELFLDSGNDALVAYNAKVHGQPYSTPYPVLEFRLNTNFPYYSYNVLNKLELTGITVTCEVEGLKNLALYNQYGQVDFSKPFQPLGLQPEKGDYLLIGSNEVFIKNVSEIELLLNWQSLPATGDFATYYSGYTTVEPYTNSSFQVEGSFLNKGKWVVPAKFVPVYDVYQLNPADDTNPASLCNQSVFRLSPLDQLTNPDSVDPANLGVPLKYDATTSGAFMRLELCAPAYGFGAGLYNNALSETVLENAKSQMKAEADSSTDTDDAKSTESTKLKPLPNPPFTPVAKSIILNYKATDVIELSPGAEEKTGYDPFYYLDVFCTYSASAVNPTESGNNKPSSANAEPEKIAGYKQLLPDYPIQGCLLIGLKELSAPQSLTLLVELSEKPSEASLSELPSLTWSYLTKKGWKNFVPELNMHDGTSHLIKSGILTFNLPPDISNESSLMPDSLFWISVRASDQLAVFGNLLSIYPQALEVEYSYAEGDQRSDLKLAPFTITKAMETIPGVKSITQPLASYGGIFRENEKAFHTRVSERLRHKKRTILPWDYQRLVLQNFPQIYKAKCLPSSSQNSKSADFLPGGINLVIIPRISTADATLASDDYCREPAFGFTVLEEIKAFIQKHASAHARVTVRNPVYERLTVKCSIKFDDNNPFFLKQLNNDINRFLTPWIEGNETAGIIGNRIQRSTILAFIQQLSYVKFVSGFSLIKTSRIKGSYHFYDSAQLKPDKQEPSDILYALTPYSVFVPVKNHLITIIDEEAYIAPEALGVDGLTLETNFIVGGDTPEESPGTKPNTLLFKKTGSPAHKDNDSEQNTFYLI